MNDRLKAIRKYTKLSQADFAAKLNVGQNYVYMMEAGKKPVTDRMISDICRIFHVREDWLRTGKGQMHVLPTRESQIADICASLKTMEEDSKQYKLVTILNSMLINMTEEQIDQVFNLVKELYDSIYKE